MEVAEVATTRSERAVGSWARKVKLEFKYELAFFVRLQKQILSHAKPSRCPASTSLGDLAIIDIATRRKPP